MATENASAPSIAAVPSQRGAAGLFRKRAALFNARVEALFDKERDQLALWLPVGLGLGIAAWFALPDAGAWKAFLFLCGALGLGAAAVAPATRWGRAIAIFLLAAILGCALIWTRAVEVAAPVLHGQRLAQFSATVEQVEPVPARDATRLVVRPLGAPDLPARVRINVAQDKWNPLITPGATVRVRAFLMPPAPMAVPGAYDFSRAAWFQRIGASGKALGVALIAPGHVEGWKYRLAGWRQRLSAYIRSRMDPGPGGIAAALATGDQGAISQDDSDAMRRSGLAHLLSVSGLHLTAVVGLVMLLSLRLLALSPALALRLPLVVIAAGAGALAGVGYTLLTGAEVPTVRSCIAALIVLAALALGREALTLRVVAVGALIVLLLWPDSLAGPSFQLSFAAITAIVALHDNARVKAWFARRDEGVAQKAVRALAGLILTGVVVELALAPIGLYHFHRAGFYGALANVVAIPLTTFVIMPLEALALLFDLAGIGAPFWWLANQSLHLLLAIAHRTAAAPGAVATLPTMPGGAFALMAGGGLWLALWRTGWRRWGFVPIAAGALWALATPAPDLIVTGDGRHLALRAPDGSYAILRDRAGDYVRGLLTETSGSDSDLGLIDELPGARCNLDFCGADLNRHGRTWHLLATRSAYLVPIDELAEACERADIVVSDRRLPAACHPKWLKADRNFLRQTGGLAIALRGTPRVVTVADSVGRHPWAQIEASDAAAATRRHPHP